MMDVREAFVRLKTRDKVALSLAAVLFLTGFIVILFLALNNMLTGNVSFPKSSANNYPNVQNKNRYEYEDLKTFLMYPGTSTGIMVGGEEIGVYADGTAFQFSSEAVIIAAMPANDLATTDFIKERFPLYLTGEENEASYTHKIASTGYLNKEYLEYEGGILKTQGGDTFYVLAYRQPSMHETDALIAVVTTQKKRLTNALVLLERIWGTLDTYEKALNAGTASDAGEEKGTAAGNGASQKESRVQYITVEGEPKDSTEEEEGEEGEEHLSRSEKMKKLQEERADLMHQTAQGEPAWLEKTFLIPEEWQEREVVFYFEYENKGKEPKEAYLTTPYGEILSPDKVSANAGYVCFIVENPAPGKWQMQISNNTAFGLYQMGANNDANETM